MAPFWVPKMNPELTFRGTDFEPKPFEFSVFRSSSNFKKATKIHYVVYPKRPRNGAEITPTLDFQDSRSAVRQLWLEGGGYFHME